MLPAEGWAPRCSAPRHAATPANKSRAAPCRIDSEWRQCEWKNRSKNGDRLEVTVQSDLGHQLRCTPITSSVKERSAARKTFHVSIGAHVARGGSKCSSNASFRLARASSSLSPWLAISTSRHCETYHFPSRQTVAANGCFMTTFFHRMAGIQNCPMQDDTETRLDSNAR